MVAARPLRSRLLPVVLASTVGGCASGVDSATFMHAAPLPPDVEVRVYSSQQPACAYEEIGLVTWRARSPFERLEKGLTRMRGRAREMGGHAIVGFRVGTQATGTTTTIRTDSASTTVGSAVNSQRYAEGVVVRFRDGPCASKPAPAASGSSRGLRTNPLRYASAPLLVVGVAAAQTSNVGGPSGGPPFGRRGALLV